MFRCTFYMRNLYRVRSKFSRLLSSERQLVSCARTLNRKETHRCFASLVHNYQEAPYEKDRVDYVTAEHIDEALSKLDQNARRYGHVTRLQVKSVYNDLKLLGKASSIQALYLLRCCGSLMCDENPQKRTELASEIWETIKEYNIPIDASHYNALMKVYLENDHQFSPTDFLSNMEKNGIEPNRVTYQRLIERYCQDGDLNGASVILEHMKEKNIPVNEAVFNSLIKGHVKSGDFEGAKSMFEVMRKSQLPPSSSTYLTLASGYAEKGDIEGMLSVLDGAEKNGVYLGNSELLSLIYSLFVSGHGDQIDKVFDRFDDLYSCRKECVNLIHSLMSKGLFEEAYTFVKRVTSSVEFIVGSSEYMKHYVALGKPVEEVLKRCQELSQLNNGSHQVYLFAVKSALDYHLEACALELFKEFLKNGIPVRCHYFWPLLVAHSNAKNPKGIFEVLKVMSDMGVLADFDTYMDFVFPSIPTSDPDNVIQTIQEIGQPTHFLRHDLMKYYCRTGNYKNALHVWESYQISNIGGSRSVITEIADGYNPKESDNGSVLKLLEHLSKEPIPDNRELTTQDLKYQKDVFGNFFFLLASTGKLSKPLFEEAYKMGVDLSNHMANKICDIIGRSNPELLQVIRSMQYGAPLPKSSKEMDYVHPRDMDVETLEQHVVKLRKMGTTVRVALRHLLVEHCKSKNLEKIISVKQELDNEGFQYSPAMYALMIEAFVALHELDRAKEMLDKFTDEYPDTKLDNVKAIHYAILLIKSGKKQDALELLKDQCCDINFSQKEFLLRAIKRLLTTAAETSDTEYAKEIYKIFSDKLDILSPSNMAESFIKAHLNRDDIAMAIEEYTTCLREHNIASCRNTLFRKLITNNDVKNLQLVVDETAAVLGKLSTLHELAFSFVECGQVQEARKVFQNLGDRVDYLHVERLSYRLVKDKKVTELENLIAATKDLIHVDRDRLYYHLLTLYVQDNDCEKALELWNCIQEENIQPSPRTLHTLANLLIKNDHPVPFVVPGGKAHEAVEITDGEELTPEGESIVSDLNNCVQSKDISGIIEILNKMKKGHVRLLPTEVVTNMVDTLLQANKLYDIKLHVQMMSYIIEKSRNIFKPLMEKYTASGNVEIFNQMAEVLPDFTLKSIGFNFYFNKAHIVSGKTEELLSALENNIGSTVKLFSLYGFMELLKLHPELEDRAIKLVDRYVEVENFDIPRRALWVYYFVNEKFPEAEQLFRKHPEMFSSMDVLSSQVFRNIRESSNETVARKFLELLKEFKMKPAHKYRAYFCLFDILVNNADYDAALNILGEAQEAGMPTSRFRRRSLLELKTQLLVNKKPVPFEISAEDNEDSSSSDSE